MPYGSRTPYATAQFDTDSSRYLTLLLVGQPPPRRTLSREELDAYLAHELKAAGVTQPLFDDMARQALQQATKGILRRVSKRALTALRGGCAERLHRRRLSRC